MTPPPINPEEQLYHQKELGSNNADIRESETSGTETFDVLKVFDYSEKYARSIDQNKTRDTVTNKTQNDLQNSVDLEIIEDVIPSVGNKTTTSNVELIEISSSNESESNEKEEERNDKTPNSAIPYMNLTHYCPTCDRLFVKPKDEAQNYCEKCKTKLLFECMICNRRYTNKIQVFGHLKTRHDCRKKPDLNCSMCEYKSIHRGYLKHHMFIKHMSMNDLEPCSKCGRHFKRAVNAREHELSCGSKPYLQCRFCDFQTTYRISFQVHMKHHIIDPKKGAALINEKFEEVSVDPDIQLGLLFKKGDTPKVVQNKIKCRNTNKKSAKTKYYIDLLFRGLIKMYCYKCKVTTSVRDVKYNNCQKCKTELIHECGLCTSKFNTCPNVIRHLRERHSSCNLVSTYVCGSCDKVINDYKQFSRHDAKCKRVVLHCEFCPYTAKSDRILRSHRDKWHLGPLKDEHRPCPICGRHMKQDFGNPAMLWCAICR